LRSGVKLGRASGRLSGCGGEGFCGGGGMLTVEASVRDDLDVDVGVRLECGGVV